MANEQRVSSDGDAALIADASADLHQRVLAVLRQGTWWKQATAEQKRQYLSNADVLAALVKIIRDDWPAGAAFDESSAASDRVLDFAPDTNPPVLAWGPCGQRWHCLTGAAVTLLRSLRRAALDALAVIAHDMQMVKEVTAQLVAAGFFDAYLFPSMLCAVCNRFWPAQDAMTAVACPDQAQGMALSLMRITAMASQVDMEVARLVVRHCMLGVFRAFQDPWQIKWEPQGTLNRAKMCAASAAAQLAHLPGDVAKRKYKNLLPPGMSRQQAAQEAQDLLEEVAGMPQLMAGLAAVILRPDVMLAAEMPYLMALSEVGHAECKIDRLLKCCPLSPAVYSALSKAAALLQRVWSTRAEHLSKKASEEELAGPVARAAALRQSGNTAFAAGQLQAALSDYQSALQQTPTNSVLYANIALVQLKLGAINEAANAAWCALSHDATNVKAWVRLGDAYREVGRWQLAQLCYQAALEQHSDPAVKERRAAALENLTAVWTWREVPEPWNTAAVGRWLGSRAAAQQSHKDVMLERLTNSSPHAHLSRYMAVQLKQLYLTADALVKVGTGAMLILPAMHEWQCGYSDTPFIGKCSGAVKHMLSIADATMSTPTSQALSPLFLVEGKPSARDLIQALAVTLLHAAAAGGSTRQLYKPKRLQLPYRMLYMYAEVKEVLQAWGVEAVEVETRAEAQRASIQCNTDWCGLNNTDRYRPENIFDLKGCKQKDKNNDQRAGSATSRAAGNSNTSAAAAAAASGSSSAVASGSPRPAQQQQEQQQSTVVAAAAAAAGSSSGAAAAGQGPFSSRSAPNEAPFDAETEQHGQFELEHAQRRRGFEVSDGSGRRRLMQPQHETVCMDSSDGVNIMRNAPDGSGRALQTQRMEIKGHRYQGRVDGVGDKTGDWEPGTQVWIKVLERTREGLSSGADLAWVRQEARQRKQLHERRMLDLRQHQLAQRRQRREQH